MGMLVHGTLRLASDAVVVYSYSGSGNADDVEGVVVVNPSDLNGYRTFPPEASRHGGEAVLAKALRAFRETGEWPPRVSHFS